MKESHLLCLGVTVTMDREKRKQVEKQKRSLAKTRESCVKIRTLGLRTTILLKRHETNENNSTQHSKSHSNF